ncbi:MAG: orotate phosphoribosyltransferase [Granulosicoccus sp.]|nr:orotate phosphoribosyltransferase [Granulosicoccus sp.]
MFTTSYASRDEMAAIAARMLLEIEAVHFRSDEPYVFTSGLASPVYIDCRKLISYPRIRSTLMDFAVSTLVRDVGYEAFDAVAGGETAGIPFAAWIADRMQLPMQYVRKKPKGFGRDARIEGDIREGQRILLVEDLTTDGGSKLSFAKAIRDAGAQVSHTLVVFYYDIFKHTPENLDKAGLQLHYLVTWWNVLAASRDAGHFTDDTHDAVEAFLHDPLAWSAAHGGHYQPKN